MDESWIELAVDTPIVMILDQRQFLNFGFYAGVIMLLSYPPIYCIS